MLEHILNDPPPPPPPNIPTISLTDPKILKMTLKERLADHRKEAACISCHAKIDPWGIAFENYDAIGGFRSQVNRKPVDATSTLFNKKKLVGVEGVKHYILNDRQDQFAKALVYKMLTYALGRPLSFSDHADIDSVTMKLRKKGNHLRDLLHLIVRTRIFNTK